MVVFADVAGRTFRYLPLLCLIWACGGKTSSDPGADESRAGGASEDTPVGAGAAGGPSTHEELPSGGGKGGSTGAAGSNPGDLSAGGDESTAGGGTVEPGTGAAGEGEGAVGVGGDGGNADLQPPTAGAAGARADTEPDPVSELASLLEGYWLTGGGDGDCMSVAIYLHFVSATELEHLFADTDACRPSDNWGTTITPGTYRLEGRTLTYELDGGSLERFDLGVGKISTTTVMYHDVFLPVDETSWRGTKISERFDDQGELEYRNEVVVDLRFAAPVPVDGSGSCTAEIDFDLAQFDAAREPGATDEAFTGSFGAVPCEYAPSAQGQRIDFDSLAWSELPFWVQTNLQKVLTGSRLWLDPAQPDFLFGSWYIKEAGEPDLP